MSTRAKIEVFDEEGRPIVTIYKHHDGDLVKQDIEEFLKNRKVVQGIPLRAILEGHVYEERYSNGMNELAAQLVTYLKRKHPIGDVYLIPHEEDYYCDYVYRVVYDKKSRRATLQICKEA